MFLLVPDLVVKVKSKTDSLEKLRSKIAEVIKLGTQVGILIDSRTRTIEVYRSQVEKLVLHDGEVLTLPDLLPGFQIKVSQIWAPVFD